MKPVAPVMNNDVTIAYVKGVFLPSILKTGLKGSLGLALGKYLT